MSPPAEPGIDYPARRESRHPVTPGSRREAPPVNDRLLRALAKKPVDRTPVWLMRQAGRYLPEYRAVRERAGSFLALCSTPELACEVTLQPLRRFALDAAILFSDILTIPWAMGLGLEFVEGEGPRFRRPVRAAADIDRLGCPDPEDDLGFVTDAVRMVRRELGGCVPLIGFAGSPWTLATYMIEGRGSRDFALAKTMLIEHPRELHRLLELLATATTGYLGAQVRAGAQALMIFDTWGGILTTPAYHEFSLEYMRRIVECLSREHESRAVPVVLFTKGGGGLDRVDGAKRLRCDRARLDGGSRECARAGGRAGRAPGEPGPDDTARFAGPDPRRGRPHPRRIWSGPRARLQPRARHHPGRRSGARRRLHRRRACAQPRIPLCSRTRSKAGRILAKYGPGPGRLLVLGHVLKLKFRSSEFPEIDGLVHLAMAWPSDLHYRPHGPADMACRSRNEPRNLS